MNFNGFPPSFGSVSALGKDPQCPSRTVFYSIGDAPALEDDYVSECSIQIAVVDDERSVHEADGLPHHLREPRVSTTDPVRGHVVPAALHTLADSSDRELGRLEVDESQPDDVALVLRALEQVELA